MNSCIMLLSCIEKQFYVYLRKVIHDTYAAVMNILNFIAVVYTVFVLLLVHYTYRQ